MNVGIIGMGHIGEALGPLLVVAGHVVTYGVEHDGAAPPAGTRVAPVGEAVAGAEVVVVAVPFGAWPDLARAHGPALGGRVVIDATNTNAQRDGAVVEAVAREGRGTLAFVAALIPGARLVKAFNTMTAEVLAKGADQPGGRLAYPLAGDDPAAVETAAGLVRDAGFDPVSVGEAASARRFDQGTPVWNHPMSADAIRAALA